MTLTKRPQLYGRQKAAAHISAAKENEYVSCLCGRQLTNMSTRLFCVYVNVSYQVLSIPHLICFFENGVNYKYSMTHTI